METEKPKPRVMIGPRDVTEHVARMYDSLVNSMDWGSDFLDWEEIQSILIVAKLAGFKVPGAQKHNPFKLQKLGIDCPLEPKLERDNNGQWEYNKFKKRLKTWEGQVEAALDHKLQEDINQMVIDTHLCESIAVDLLTVVETPRK